MQPGASLVKGSKGSVSQSPALASPLRVRKGGLPPHVPTEDRSVGGPVRALYLGVPGSPAAALGEHSRPPPEPKLGTRGILLFPPKKDRWDSAASPVAADSPWTKDKDTVSSRGLRRAGAGRNV